MNTALFIARRIDLRGSRRRPGAGIIIAIVGISLAMTVMMLSIAVMQGFKDEIRAKITGFESQITIVATDDNGDDNRGDNDISNSNLPVTLTPALSNVISETIPEAQIFPCATRPGVLKTSENFAGIIFKASPPESNDMAFVADHITEGSMPDYNAPADANSIIISRAIASRLELHAGDKVDAYFFAGGGMKMRRFLIAAIYDTHFSDYDTTIAFAPLSMVAKLDKLAENTGSRIEVNGIKGGDDAIEPAAKRLQQALLDAHIARQLDCVYRVDNVHRRGAVYFNWLSLLDTNVAVILALMAAVSGFTLISSLFIIILERVNMIGILKAIGAGNHLVRHIFILVALKLVACGLFIGNIVGLGIIVIQRYTHILPLDAETYYLNFVPVSISWIEVVVLNISVILLSILVLLLPSHIVAGISPARTIRYD